MLIFFQFLNVHCQVITFNVATIPKFYLPVSLNGYIFNERVRKKTNALNRDVKALSILLIVGKYIYEKNAKIVLVLHSFRQLK